MAKAVSVVSGVIVAGLGVWGIVTWWDSILLVLEFIVSVSAVLVGLGILVFGLSELWTGQPKSAPPPPAPLPHGPGEPA